MIITEEQNPKLGFYQLGSEMIFNKVQALVQATRTKQFPEWNFNRDIFGAMDWTLDPGSDIRLLYQQRAQQLREQYDYIRLEFSGGSDSFTALHAFVSNNIHIDEVVFRYPKTGEKEVCEDPFNYKAENTLSEAKYAAFPALTWLRDQAPRTKITVHDYSENMISSTHDESWVYGTKDYFQPGHAFKHSKLGHADHRRQADSGVRTCILYGVDKPKICIQDKKWYAYFLDITANTAVTDAGNYDNLITEYFFWTPDYPLILLRQAHIIKNWFDQPCNHFLQYVCRWPNYSFVHKNAYESIVKPLIYPDYDPATFQTNKPTNSFYNEMDFWFYKNFKSTYQYQAWQAGLKYLVSAVDAKFFNYELGKPVGFVGFISPFYYLGEANYLSDPKNEHYRF